MPKLVDVPAQKRSIRRAARQVFARRGVAGTGLAQVADAAGMARSSLYHYYPHKAALVRDLLGDLLRDEERLFASAARGDGGPLERIERLAAALPRLFDAWAQIGRLLVELRARDARRFRTFFRRIRADLSAVIEEGQRSGEIDAGLDAGSASALLVGIVDGLLLQHMVDPEVAADPAALGDDLARAVRRLLRP